VFDSFSWKASAEVLGSDVHLIPTPRPEWRRARLPANPDVVAFH